MLPGVRHREGYSITLIFPPKISSVQFSCSLCPTICDPMGSSTPGLISITNSWRLLKLMSMESVMTSNHLILSHPLLLLPSIFPSIRVFSKESLLCIRWPKYCKDQKLESHHEEMLETCYKKTSTCSKISRSENTKKD